MTFYKHGILIETCHYPHQGHVALAHFAANQCEHVTFYVKDEFDDQIPIGIRIVWLQEAINNSRVTVKKLPSAFSSWHKSIKQNDIIISDHEEGKQLANQLNVTWLPFNSQPLQITDESLEKHPWKNWQKFIPPLQAKLVRRILIVGPESTGKSMLAMKLAASSSYSTIAIPEYAETWIKKTNPQQLSNSTLKIFLQGQIACEKSVLTLANRWLILDSNALTTAIWALHLKLDIAQQALAIAKLNPPDHVLLLSPQGAPWVNDTHRYKPDERITFFKLFEEQLKQLQWPYTIIEGNWQNRFNKANDVINHLLTKWQALSLPTWLAEKNIFFPSKNYFSFFKPNNDSSIIEMVPLKKQNNYR